MTLKRKLAGLSTALLAALALVKSFRQGWITMTDISAALAFTLVGIIVASLYWSWRPEIGRWFVERNQPKLTVAPTELKDDERIAEVELVLRDGEVRKHEVRFYYITVKNSGRRSAEDVAAYYDGADRIMFMPLRRKQTYKIDYNYTSEGFDHEIETFGEEQAFALALLREGKLEWTRTIHPGPIGETFALFFTVKGFRLLTIPAGSRLYPNYNEGIPCSITIPLCLTAKDMPDPYVVIFKVDVQSWNSFKVEQVKSLVRRSGPGGTPTA